MDHGRPEDVPGGKEPDDVRSDGVRLPVRQQLASQRRRNARAQKRSGGRRCDAVLVMPDVIGMPMGNDPERARLGRVEVDVAAGQADVGITLEEGRGHGWSSENRRESLPKADPG